MAESIFDSTAISQAEPYWLEELPYTSLQTISPSAQPSLFSPVSNWNHATSPSTQVSLQRIGATADPRLQMLIQNDKAKTSGYGTTALPYLSSMPPDLRQVEFGRGAVKNLSLSLINTSATDTITNFQMNYTIRIWKMTAAYKIMAGIPLTQQEKAAVEALGMKPTFDGMQGDLPVPIDRYVQGEYGNRNLVVEEQFLRPQLTTSAAQIFGLQVPVNEIAVIRSIGSEARVDDGAVLQIDRDANENHLSIRLDQANMRDGLSMFIPARSTIVIKAYAQTAPVAPTPIRLVIWRIALSNILRYRLGMIELPQLQQIYGQKQGEILSNHIIVGVK